PIRHSTPRTFTVHHPCLAYRTCTGGYQNTLPSVCGLILQSFYIHPPCDSVPPFSISLFNGWILLHRKIQDPTPTRGHGPRPHVARCGLHSPTPRPLVCCSHRSQHLPRGRNPP